MCKKELKEKRRTTMKKPFLNSFPKEFTNLFLLNIFLFFFFYQPQANREQVWLQLQPDNVVLLLTRKLGLRQLCKPDGLALYTPDENSTNEIKASDSQIFDLRHSLVVKLGKEMEELTEEKGVFNS